MNPNDFNNFYSEFMTFIYDNDFAKKLRINNITIDTIKDKICVEHKTPLNTKCPKEVYEYDIKDITKEIVKLMI